MNKRLDRHNANTILYHRIFNLATAGEKTERFLHNPDGAAGTRLS